MIPDVMLIPLAAFDRQGHRIGYGAGHYDYTLAHLRKVKAIAAVGIAFAVQEIKAVPALPHDVALDYVLTEKKMFDFRS
jgi:5-formyltetrahydrofolate cyclo-ligase